ncbi:MAG: TlpA family protein disulfide reductase, partial [Acidimicrobiales bacterium]
TGVLRDLAGAEPLVVNLFASWCPPCIAEMPDFEAVSAALGDEVRFFGLAVTDRPEDASRIVEETGVTYDWSRDIQGDIAAGFGVTTMPSTIFITKDGEVAHIQSGALDQDRLRALIDEHLGVPA